ncbi:LuxR C-terminal-related transcriptional regulator [Arthrobacter sp. CAN_A214]|uniref:LuxR C-terminal-related transcriptional regulator n=1 Tax=Arthrobacter sp. CAN_A214 TaxID=2787720 RepID=UPI0018C9545D
MLNRPVKGLSNNAIAAELGTSPYTVAVHVQALLRISGATSRTDLALRELRRRLTAHS